MMNDRIQELAYDAEDYADTMVDGGSEFHPTFVKKFAELIIQECCDIIEEDGSAVLPLIIKKHFGITE